MQRMFIVILVAGFLVPVAEGQQTEDRLGTVQFESSCSPAAQTSLNRAVASLHSFAFPAAAQGFNAAIAADAGCAIAYWGLALTAWGNPFAAGIKPEPVLTRGLDAITDADAYLSIPGGFPTGYYDEITRLANAKRLPAMFHAQTGSTVDALATYGASDVRIAQEAARLVDKILKGANAGELPVERPTKLDLVINLKTAKQIGLTIPPNVLARADRVIR